MYFRDVIGQEAVKQQLRRSVQEERVTQGMMFMGNEGNGALVLAIAFAQYINCTNRQGDEACGVCTQCTKTAKLIHPDLHFTYPVITKKSGTPPVSTDYITEWREAVLTNPYLSYNQWMQHIGAENKQGNITVKECHSIIHKLNLRAYEGTYKVQIIWLAAYLQQAGNVLLKILEEPPANTVFILIVENQEAILNTILSRCQIIKLPDLQDADIANALAERQNTEPEQARRISRIAHGNYNAALSMLGGDEGENDTYLMEWLSYAMKKGLREDAEAVANLYNWTEKMARLGRENQKNFFKYALFFLRECTLLKAGVESRMEGQELAFAQKLASHLELEQLEELNSLMSRLHYYIERNANPRILFFNNSLKIARILGKKAALEAV